MPTRGSLWLQLSISESQNYHMAHSTPVYSEDVGHKPELANVSCSSSYHVPHSCLGAVGFDLPRGQLSCKVINPHWAGVGVTLAQKAGAPQEQISPVTTPQAQLQVPARDMPSQLQESLPSEKPKVWHSPCGVYRSSVVPPSPNAICYLGVIFIISNTKLICSDTEPES